MSDRELLTMAAKAAGIEITWENSLPHPQRIEYFRGMPNYFVWNPLTDDGDRYRLAQKLRINIDFADGCAWHRSPLGGLIQEFWGEDCPDEAHAIVGIAAEIGKAMP